MDFSFSDLNFNSVENLPGFEARAAFTVNSASMFCDDVVLCLPSWTIASLIFRGEATIKYHIEIGAKYWESIFRAEGITDRRKQQERIVREKQTILDFLTGAENSGNT